ncbi:MAG TPA: hypothetical protein VFR37_09270, partial [Longimicrobium sp.]|nr:hypothetical protein [Longimicrobium sp.]
RQRLDIMGEAPRATFGLHGTLAPTEGSARRTGPPDQRRDLARTSPRRRPSRCSSGEFIIRSRGGHDSSI